MFTSRSGLSCYRIAEGDTLSELAIKLHTSVEALRRVNHISDPDWIYAGNILVLPKGAW